MLHSHTTSDGRKTSFEVVDPEDANNHWHTVDGEKTGNDKFGAGHTHMFSGIKTTGPVEDDESEEKLIQIKFKVTEVEKKQSFDTNGIPVGIVKGYIATWDLDRGDWSGLKDRFVRGAFRESLADMKARNRNIRFKDHHGRTVGNFPINTVFEDDRGLFGEGHLNLDVQQGKEAYSLALQKSLTDFSIGFSAEEFTIDDDIRTITKATVWEGSIVDEPMNPAAQITEVKNKITAEQIEAMTERQLESALKANGFSKEAAKRIVFKHKEKPEEGNLKLLEFFKKVNSEDKDKEINRKVLEEIKQLSKSLKKA